MAKKSLLLMVVLVALTQFVHAECALLDSDLSYALFNVREPDLKYYTYATRFNPASQAFDPSLKISQIGADETIAAYGDFDHDGNFDVLTYAYSLVDGTPGAIPAYSDGKLILTLFVYWGDRNPSICLTKSTILNAFTFSNFKVRPVDANTFHLAIGTADLDLNGMSDIILNVQGTTNANDAKSFHVLQSSARSFSPPPVSPGDFVDLDPGGSLIDELQSFVVTVGDFTSDGQPDMLVLDYHRERCDQFKVYLARGIPVSPYFQLQTASPAFMTRNDVMAVFNAGDSNGDGKLDVLYGLDDDGDAGQLWKSLGNGDGTFVSPDSEVFDIDPVHEPVAPDPGCQSGSTGDKDWADGKGFMALRDFNGDGKDDIVLCQYQNFKDLYYVPAKPDGSYDFSTATVIADNLCARLVVAGPGFTCRQGGQTCSATTDCCQMADGYSDDLSCVGVPAGHCCPPGDIYTPYGECAPPNFAAIPNGAWCPVGLFPESRNATQRILPSASDTRVQRSAMAIDPVDGTPVVAWINFPDSLMVKKWNPSSWRWETMAGDPAVDNSGMGLRVTSDNALYQMSTSIGSADVTGGNSHPGYNFSQVSLQVDSHGTPHVVAIVERGKGNQDSNADGVKEWDTDVLYARWDPITRQWVAESGTPLPTVDAFVSDGLRTNSTFPVLALDESTSVVIPKVAWVEYWGWNGGTGEWSNSEVRYKQWDPDQNSWVDLRGNAGAGAALSVSKTVLTLSDKGASMVEDERGPLDMKLLSNGEPVIGWVDDTSGTYDREVLVKKACHNPLIGDWCDMSETPIVPYSYSAREWVSLDADLNFDSSANGESGEVRLFIDTTDRVHVAWGLHSGATSRPPYSVLYRHWSPAIQQWVNVKNTYGNDPKDDYALNVSAEGLYEDFIAGIHVGSDGLPIVAFRACMTNCPRTTLTYADAATDLYVRKWRPEANNSNGAWVDLTGEMRWLDASNASNGTVSGWAAGGGDFAFAPDGTPYIANPWDEYAFTQNGVKIPGPVAYTQVQVQRMISGPACPFLSSIELDPGSKSYVADRGSYSQTFTPSCFSGVGAGRTLIACPPLYWSTTLSDASVSPSGVFTLQAMSPQSGTVRAAFYDYPSSAYSDDAGLVAAGTAIIDVTAQSNSPPTPAPYNPLSIPANLIELSCPVLAPTERTEFRLECLHDTQPCAPLVDPNPPFLSYPNVNANFIRRDGAYYYYEIYALQDGAYVINAEYPGVGKTSCTINRISTSAALTVPDLPLFLIPLLLLAAGLFIRRKNSRL